MTTTKRILTAIADFFCGVFTLPVPMARRGDNKRRSVNFLSVLCAVFAFGLLTACGGGGISSTAKSSSQKALDDQKDAAKFGWTPLHLAIKNDHHAKAKRLIGSGADIEARDEQGRTPFFFANAEGRNLLVKAGADINAKDNDGFTELQTTIIASCCWDVTDTIIHLIELGVDVNSKDNEGTTALHGVALLGNSSKNIALALLLIKAGADVKAETYLGETPADLAIHKHGKDSRIARFLLKHEGKE